MLKFALIKKYSRKSLRKVEFQRKVGKNCNSCAVFYQKGLVSTSHFSPCFNLCNRDAKLYNSSRSNYARVIEEMRLKSTKTGKLISTHYIKLVASIEES